MPSMRLRQRAMATDMRKRSMHAATTFHIQQRRTLNAHHTSTNLRDHTRGMGYATGN